MIKKVFCIIVFFFFLLKISAQTNINTSHTLEKKNQEIAEQIVGILETSHLFDYSFSEYPYIKSLISQDQLVRILTWCFQDSIGTYHYLGIVLLRKNKKAKHFQIIQLKDEYLKMNLKNLETAILSSQKWLGSQYIEIFQFNKSSSEQIYYLLGIQKLNDKIIRRVVEPLVVVNDSIQFGSSGFKRRNQKTVRYLFEYSAMSSMQMNFNPKIKTIEYTHNIPPNAAALHSSPFAPDIKYNALMFQKGEWQLVDILKQYNPNLTTTPIQRKKRQNKQFWKTPE